MNLNQFRASFSPEALAGGEQVYAAGGVVRIVRGLSGRVYATVRDRGADAHVAAALDRDGTVSELNCSCASPRFCRHQAALLTALAAAPADEAFPGGVRPCLFPGRGFAALCPEYLTAAARGPETQAEARRICGMDRVRVVSDEALPGGLRTVSARVGSHNRFSSGEEDVSLTLLPGGLPQKGLCGCMPDGGEFLCQHMTALLLTLFPDDTAPDVETSAPARRLLAAAAAAALPDPRTEGGLRLVPELSFDIGEQPRLSFRVGRDKLWTVRSVDEFLDNVRAGRTAAFGRGAAFRLDVDAFDEAGRAMIRFLRAHRRGDGFAPRDGAGLPLNESSIDDFFDALGGAELLFDGTPLRTVRRDPPAALTVSPAGRNGCALRFSGPAPRFVGAGEYCYVVADGALYASTREFCRLAAELLRSLCAAGETGLLLSLSDLGPFWTGVLLP
ncbi:MAG: SNF2 helicase associated domain-containing protein, partial [Oscillospiraceae bacterium]|nr:SNF2 helicase associated domain-containing protein [Oscillospiraceae bacterium]